MVSKPEIEFSKLKKIGFESVEQYEAFRKKYGATGEKLILKFGWTGLDAVNKCGKPALKVLEKYNIAGALALYHGLPALKQIKKYGLPAVSAIASRGKPALDVISSYGRPAARAINKYDLHAVNAISLYGPVALKAISTAEKRKLDVLPVLKSMLRQAQKNGLLRSR